MAQVRAKYTTSGYPYTVVAGGSIASSDWNAVPSDECVYTLGISGVSSTSDIHSAGNETTWANSGTFPSGDTWYLSSDGGAYLGLRTDNEKERSKRMLYEVFIVDPDEEMIVYHGLEFSGSESGAERKALLNAEAEDCISKDPDEYDFGTRKVMALRPKREVQEVKLVM